MGLFDMVMIKDNHISIAGGVTNALKSVDLYLEQNNLQMGVEVLPHRVLFSVSVSVPFFRTLYFTHYFSCNVFVTPLIC